MSAQLPLTLTLKDSATFANYLPGPNAEALAYLSRLSGNRWETSIYLWGPAGAGKSHLLQAVCHAATERGAAAFYLPLSLADRFPCGALEGLEKLAMVCIDDVQLIAGRDDWELALRGLFERVQDAGGGLVVAGDAAPTELGLRLPQLISRLTSGLLVPLKPLPEADILGALRLRVSRRGLHLADDAARYLARHYGHDLGVLFETLDLLDQASLAAQRRLTIPFIRNALKTPPARDKP